MDIESMAGRIAQGVVGEMLSDTEALDHITGLLSGREWDDEMLAQVAQFVRETGRDVSRPEAGIGDEPGYDPNEGEWGDYDEDDGDDLLASVCDEVLDPSGRPV